MIHTAVGSAAISSQKQPSRPLIASPQRPYTSTPGGSCPRRRLQDAIARDMGADPAIRADPSFAAPTAQNTVASGADWRSETVSKRQRQAADTGACQIP